MNIFKNILISVAFFMLGISVFAFYLPVESKSTLETFILILQIFVVFIFHTAKSNKRFIFHSIVLIAANTTNLVYIFISSKQANQTTDILGTVMLNTAFAIWEVMQTAIIIIIFIEFTILLVRRLLAKRKSIANKIIESDADE